MRSCASPPLRKKLTGLPNASTRAWILVLSPPRDRPIASSSSVFLCAGAVLMSSHDGAVYHGVFVVGIRRQMLQDPFPDAALGPPGKPRVNLDRIAESLRQIAPGYASAIPVEHGFDEQPVVTCRHPYPAFAARQQVLDTVPLVVTQAITAHQSASQS